MAASSDHPMDSTSHFTVNRDSGRRSSVPVLSISSDRQSLQPVERRLSQQEMYSFSRQDHYGRDEWAGYSRESSQSQQPHQHQSPRGHSLYVRYPEQQQMVEYRQFHHHHEASSHLTENNIPYRNDHQHHQQYRHQHHEYADLAATYTPRSDSYDEHYGSGLMHNENLDGNEDVRHVSNNGFGLADKHRNNSVSSNNSSNNSSCPANKHPCKFPTCGWSFKRFEHLKRHMLVHTKERPFVCEFQGCEKSFSRSDNFSAHLRTHTKKSAHIHRFERHHMVDPMGFVPMDTTTAGHIEGSNMGMSARGPSSESMMSSGGTVGMGYSEYASTRPSPPSSATQLGAAAYMSNASVHANAHRSTSRDLSADHGNIQDDDHESYKASPPSTPSALSFGFSLDRSCRGISGTAAAAEQPPSMPSGLYNSGNNSGSNALNTTSISSNVDLNSKVLPSFSPIKLDIKAISNNPDDVHLHNQHNPKIESFGESSQERERDYAQHDYKGHPHHAKRHSYDRHASLGFRSPSPSESPSGSRYGPSTSRRYHISHDEPNPNPNGESPAQPERTRSPKHKGSFVSHFVPFDNSSEQREGYDVAMEDDNDDADDAEELLRAERMNMDSYCANYQGRSSLHMSRSVSPSHSVMPVRILIMNPIIDVRSRDTAQIIRPLPRYRTEVD
ncbi:hypothetical protein EDD11_002724 [Mortierella claussenii]|nr:hypothetical protein EDD11_002724 [Mortierella claussenii]